MNILLKENINLIFLTLIIETNTYGAICQGSCLGLSALSLIYLYLKPYDGGPIISYSLQISKLRFREIN